MNMKYTDAELESLLDDVESDLAEPKESWKGDAPDKGRHAVCAFANDPPVRYKGRIWIRTGPRRGLATSQDERILNEKRKFRDLPFDVHPLPLSTLKDIDRLLFEQEYLPNAFAPDVLETNERSYEQRLAACRMIVSADNPTPTVLGIVVLGRNPTDWLPGACIQFLRIDGIQWSDDVADEELIDGPLAQMLRRIVALVACIRKLIVILNAMLKKKQPFCELYA
ncbi:MAG: hypothetical protein ACLPVO_19545 [Desulfomonilaceae bacterium]